MKKEVGPTITARQLIEADWEAKTPIKDEFQLRPLDQVVHISKELWFSPEDWSYKGMIQMNEKDQIHLWLVWMQLLQVPEAKFQFIQCFAKFRRGPGRRWQEFIRQIKRRERPLNLKQFKAFKESVNEQVEAAAIAFMDDPQYVASVESIFKSWVDNWGRGSWQFLWAIHELCVGSICQEEMSTEHPRTRNRISMKAIRALQKAIWGKLLRREKVALTEVTDEPTDFLVWFVTQSVGRPVTESWQLLLTTKGKDRDKSARKKARGTLRDQGYEKSKKHTIVRAVWCFVKLVVLAKGEDPQKELDRLIHGRYSLPFPELFHASDDDLRRFMKPVFNALKWELKEQGIGVLPNSFEYQNAQN